MLNRSRDQRTDSSSIVGAVCPQQGKGAPLARLVVPANITIPPAARNGCVQAPRRHSSGGHYYRCADRICTGCLLCRTFRESKGSKCADILLREYYDILLRIYYNI